jgi:hypothetical protein
VTVLDDLRSLHATLGVAIDLLERLEPVVATWRAESPDADCRAVEAQPGVDVAAASDHPSEMPLVHSVPAGANGQGNSGHHAGNGICAECGGPMERKPRGARKRYCNRTCQECAAARRKREQRAHLPRESLSEVPRQRSQAQPRSIRGRFARKASPDASSPAIAEPEPDQAQPARNPAQPSTRGEGRGDNWAFRRLYPQRQAERDEQVTAQLADLAKVPPATSVFPPRSAERPPAVPWEPEKLEPHPYAIGG